MGADQLISPPRCVTLGLDAEEYAKVTVAGHNNVMYQELSFLQPRSKKQLRKTLQLSGIRISDDVFDTIFQSASQADGTDNNACTLASFMQARKHYLTTEIE